MHVKKDDKVIVISGKDKGTIGKVIKSFPKENRGIVENVNVRKKHLKATNHVLLMLQTFYYTVTLAKKVLEQV